MKRFLLLHFTDSKATLKSVSSQPYDSPPPSPRSVVLSLSFHPLKFSSPLLPSRLPSPLESLVKRRKRKRKNFSFPDKFLIENSSFPPPSSLTEQNQMGRGGFRNCPHFASQRKQVGNGGQGQHSYRASSNIQVVAKTVERNSTKIRGIVA